MVTWRRGLLPSIHNPEALSLSILRIFPSLRLPSQLQINSRNPKRSLAHANGGLERPHFVAAVEGFDLKTWRKPQRIKILGFLLETF